MKNIVVLKEEQMKKLKNSVEVKEQEKAVLTTEAEQLKQEVSSMTEKIKEVKKSKLKAQKVASKWRRKKQTEEHQESLLVEKLNNEVIQLEEEMKLCMFRFNHFWKMMR